MTRSPEQTGAGPSVPATPTALTGLTAAACVACCAVPLLLVAGIVGGAGWALAGRVLPGVAVVLAATAGLAWWRAGRRRRTAPAGPAGGGADSGGADPGCGDPGCACGHAESTPISSRS